MVGVGEIIHWGGNRFCHDDESDEKSPVQKQLVEVTFLDPSALRHYMERGSVLPSGPGLEEGFLGRGLLDHVQTGNLTLENPNPPTLSTFQLVCEVYVYK